MSISVDDIRAVGVTVDRDELRVRMRDGRAISAPLSWFPRLADATPAERSDWRLIGDGEGIRCPQIVEDISVAGLLGRR